MNNYRRMMIYVFSTMIAIVTCHATVMGPEVLTKCEAVNKNCTARVGCGMALHNFLLGCDTIISGQTINCTSQCKRALISLFSTEESIGRSLTTCDCQGDSFCTWIKNKVNVCATSVLDAMQSLQDKSTVVSCSLAQWLCEADAHCQTAITYFLNHCQAMFHGLKCTDSCRDSLNILYRQSKAAKLRNCVCEDRECSLMRENSQRLCFNNKSGYIINENFHGSSCAFDVSLSIYRMLFVSMMLCIVSLK